MPVFDSCIGDAFPGLSGVDESLPRRPRSLHANQTGPSQQIGEKLERVLGVSSS
jgi:hypothetical protein